MPSTSTEEPNDPPSVRDGSRSPISIEPAGTALFFDFDGTLAAIADEPAAVRVEARIIDALDVLREASGGALAIVSGRSIEQIDQFLYPLRLPAAGVHGIERRDAQGRFSRVEVDRNVLDRLQAEIAAFVEGRPGLLAELKPGSVALHYRKRADLGPACREFAAGLVSENPQIRIVTGKKVIELKLADRTKADAIVDFMSAPPFAGRRPLFAGDDLTDEDGFAAVARMNGISIKVGEGESMASHRLRDIAAFHDWLTTLARRGMVGLPN